MHVCLRERGSGGRSVQVAHLHKSFAQLSQPYQSYSKITTHCKKRSKTTISAKIRNLTCDSLKVFEDVSRARHPSRIAKKKTSGNYFRFAFVFELCWVRAASGLFAENNFHPYTLGLCFFVMVPNWARKWVKNDPLKPTFAPQNPLCTHFRTHFRRLTKTDVYFDGPPPTRWAFPFETMGRSLGL